MFFPGEMSQRICKMSHIWLRRSRLGSVKVIFQKQGTCLNSGGGSVSFPNRKHFISSKELSRKTVTVTGFASSPIHSTTSQNTNLK